MTQVLARSVSITTLIAQSGAAFGTSGALGLATAITDEVCLAYTCAFLHHMADIG